MLRFDGETWDHTLDGDVTTVTLGADAARGRWLGGLALAHSAGTGGWRGRAGSTSGRMKARSTTVHPYLQFRASEHLSF